jgi:hypothetical protein
VSSVRHVRSIHVYLSVEKGAEWLTMSEAAKALGVTNHTIRRLMTNILPAVQFVPGAPLPNPRIQSGDRCGESCGCPKEAPSNASFGGPTVFACHRRLQFAFSGCWVLTEWQRPKVQLRQEVLPPN